MIKQEIEGILDDLGMKGQTAAKAMGITYGTFRNKKSGSPGHSFNAKNLKDLVDFVIKKSSGI